MTTRTTFKVMAITLAAMGAAMAPAAFATSSNEISVDINTRYLETDLGVEKIYDVLSNKAESACATTGTRGIPNRKAERDCMTDLLNDFIESAGHDRLTSYHATVTN